MKFKKHFIISGGVLLVVAIFCFTYWQKGYLIDQDRTSIVGKEIGTKNFLPNSKSPGNENKYNIDLKLHSDGMFQINSTVLIKNTSPDAWDKLVFYFIPNMFTEENSPELSDPATHHFNQVAINGEASDFDLNEDTLSVPLNEELRPDKEIEVEFIYDLTLPEEGLRFTKENEDYYLAQFYPMVATYRDNQWNKEPYLFRGETYHTSFSDFKINYDIPNDYTIVSTSEDDPLNESQGSLKASNVKEVFISLLKEPKYEITKSGDTTIRVFGDDKELSREISKEAAKVFSFFEKKIGPYPFKQLDVVNGTIGMEYPGIVTVGSIYDLQVKPAQLKQMIAHEIAHQWFYGMVSNDPFHEAWLDEGFATFAQGLYFYSTSEEELDYHEFIKRLESESLKYPVNLSLNEYPEGASGHVYGKAPAKLWEIFEHRGKMKGAEDFLNSYFHFYKDKEVDTKEFIRFSQYYFNMKDTSEFESWLEIEN